MNGELVLRRTVRAVATLIAIAAINDPEITTRRAARPEVELVVADSARDAELADRVAGALGKRFTVVRSPLASASGSVVVGDRPPAGERELASPIFAVTPGRADPRVTIEHLDVPGVASSDSRIPVLARARIAAARGRRVDVTLLANERVVDRAERSVSGDDERMTFGLAYVPASVGTVRLRVVASLGDASRRSIADAAVDVRDRRWEILVFDARPSWTSTFVRRALEQDTRFVVTSRVVTSRNVSTQAGAAPLRLIDGNALAKYDAIVVGAPDALSAADVAGLESFLRRRGGGVALLLDSRASGPYLDLVGVSSWKQRVVADGQLLATADDPKAIKAADLALPVTPVGGGTPIAGPSIWATSVGIGRVVVSGALDAWRYRDSSESHFDSFWRQRVATLAAGAVPPVVLDAPSLVQPGERLQLTVTLRESEKQVPRLRFASARDDIKVTALGTQQFVASIRAPDKPGVLRLEASAGSDRAELPIVVAADAHRAAPSAPDVLAAWAATRGGRSYDAANVDELQASMASVIPTPMPLRPWRPMHSAWWMLPFALALSAEWWLRRRRGLK